MKKDRAKLQRNVREIYQLPAHSGFAKQFERQVFHHQAIAMLETLAALMRRPDYLDFVDFEPFQQEVMRLLAQGRGLIVVTGHMGSWELVAQVTAMASGREFYALAKPSKLAAFSVFLEKLRANMKTRVLWTNRRSLLREMMQILKTGQCLGFVMDQKPEGRKGPVVDFMGRPTEFVAGPAKLAMKLKAPVLGVFCMRDGQKRYRVHYEPIMTGEEDWSEAQATQKMAHAIEAMIRLYPEQWVWNYKRWRFDPQ
jgi:KDO2-lipid IV(A) lauroyltransferase